MPPSVSPEEQLMQQQQQLLLQAYRPLQQIVTL